jgi:hypothetical protein
VAWPRCAHTFSPPDLVLLSLFCRWLSLFVQPWAILAPAELSHAAPSLQRKELASEFGSFTSCRRSLFYPRPILFSAVRSLLLGLLTGARPGGLLHPKDFCRCFPLCASWVKARVFPMSPKGRHLLLICSSGLHRLLLHLSLA